MSQRSLENALERGLLRPLDYHFALRLAARARGHGDAVALAAALVSQRLGRGDVCLDLEAAAGTAVLSGVVAPPLGQWRAALLASGSVGEPGLGTPLVLDGPRLYLERYWRYERDLAARLREMAGRPAAACDVEPLRAGLERLFPLAGEAIDWQRVAAVVALARPFCLISGGPGTGKTHTVAAILVLLIEQALRLGQPLRLALAAPTGKAAARLSEAIRQLRQRLALDGTVLERMPAEASTLHRLLGVRPGRVQPRHHQDNPLHLDLLVVDEASMIDLPLLARTLDALPGQARLILLGDKDQLASVEAGSVFADLCVDSEASGHSAEVRQLLGALGMALPEVPPARPFDDGIVLLRKSWRFDQYSGIGRLAQAVNRADRGAVVAVLSEGRPDLEWVRPAEQPLAAWLAGQALTAFGPVFAAASPEAALAALDHYRILCALRQGPSGVEQVNRRVADSLCQAGLIRGAGEHYRGRPLLITRNAPGLGLFNGDIGILWPDQEGALRAWFRLPDGRLRALSLGRLPPHETAYALTVHKSQGSEFNQVLLLLPERDSPVLTRELLYTGISRAVSRVTLWGDWPVLEAALGKVVERASGLAERLRWGG